jgi:hypothetical protein
MWIRSKLRLLAAVFLVAACSIPCVAQSSAQPAWLRITTTQVKPEMSAQFETYVQQFVAAHRKGGTRWLLTLKTFAGDTTEYTTIVPVKKFADLDGPSVPASVLGENAWKSLQDEMARCYRSQSVEYATPLTALAINKKDVPAGLYWVDTRSEVFPNKMEDYLDWLKNSYRPALDKAGVAQFRVAIGVFGAEGGEVLSMRSLKDLAEIDGGSILTRALSEDGARVVSANGASLVRESSTRILRTLPELSYSLDN